MLRCGNTINTVPSIVLFLSEVRSLSRERPKVGSLVVVTGGIEAGGWCAGRLESRSQDKRSSVLSTGRKKVRKISVPTLLLHEIYRIAFTNAFIVTSRSPSG